MGGSSRKTPSHDAPKKAEIELLPDGWERFEGAVDAAVKSGPKHREGQKKQAKRNKSARNSG